MIHWVRALLLLCVSATALGQGMPVPGYMACARAIGVTISDQFAVLPGMAHSVVFGINRQVFWHSMHSFLSQPKGTAS